LRHYSVIVLRLTRTVTIASLYPEFFPAPLLGVRSAPLLGVRSAPLLGVRSGPLLV